MCCRMRQEGGVQREGPEGGQEVNNIQRGRQGGFEAGDFGQEGLVGRARQRGKF